jgi:hypothetical protein
MHNVQLRAIQDFILQNKKVFISTWQHLHEDPESCAFDVTFTTWLIQIEYIDLGWVIARTCRYALFPTYNCN